jgi:hypothetical protein
MNFGALGGLPLPLQFVVGAVAFLSKMAILGLPGIAALTLPACIPVFGGANVLFAAAELYVGFGAAWGLVGAITGSVDLSKGGIDVITPLWPEGAITFGPIRIYNDKVERDYGHDVYRHEPNHTAQFYALGPLFLPAIGVSWRLGLGFDSGDFADRIHGPHSFLEHDAAGANYWGP